MTWSRLARSTVALWVAFALVHAWLAFVGVVWVPQKAFWDVDLYRYWIWLGEYRGDWPVLSGPWVYPAGALLPLLVAAVAGTWHTMAYDAAWAGLVTLLDAVGMVALLHAPRLVRHGLFGEPVTDDGAADPTRNRTLTGGWWWIAFLAALGPVAMGRLDAIVVPITICALVLALKHPRVASVLLTVGAWIKVAPGALMLPLFVSARRQWRDVVLPAAVVCVVVVGLVAAGGGLANVASFLTEQGARGMQMESVGATPWLIGGLYTTSITRFLDRELITWEITGPGVQTAVDVLGWLIPLSLVAAVALLWWRRQRVGQGLWRDDRADAELLVRGSMLMVLVLIVFNKVGSPQYMTWLAPPVAVALALRLPRWRVTAWGVLAIAVATQIEFPWMYDGVIWGRPEVTDVLAARNAALVALLVLTVRELVRRPQEEAPAVDAGPEVEVTTVPVIETLDGRVEPVGPVAPVASVGAGGPGGTDEPGDPTDATGVVTSGPPPTR
jgi:hypothetical protein